MKALNTKVQIIESFRMFLAAFFFVTGITYIRNLYIRSIKKDFLVRAVLVHHIKNLSAFEDMIRLYSLKSHPISWTDFVDGKLSETKINVLLTFDDGYKSWSEEALLVLEKYNFPAIFFISSGFVRSQYHGEGQVEVFCRNNLKLNWSSKPLDKEDIKKLATHPLITIGGHTCSHPNLSVMDRSSAYVEISEDKKWIEEISGVPIEVFAYPFGLYTNSTLDAVKDAGYSGAFSTQGNYIRKRKNQYSLPRSNHGTVGAFYQAVWLHGGFDVSDMILRFVRSFIKRVSK